MISLDTVLIPFPALPTLRSNLLPLPPPISPSTSPHHLPQFPLFLRKANGYDARVALDIGVYLFSASEYFSPEGNKLKTPEESATEAGTRVQNTISAGENTEGKDQADSLKGFWKIQASQNYFSTSFFSSLRVVYSHSGSLKGAENTRESTPKPQNFISDSGCLRQTPSKPITKTRSFCFAI